MLSCYLWELACIHELPRIVFKLLESYGLTGCSYFVEEPCNCEELDLAFAAEFLFLGVRVGKMLRDDVCFYAVDI